MTTSQSAKTVMIYTPYAGNLIPIYNGTTTVPTPFAELAVATSDTTKNPSPIGASKVNDWFVWNDSGTIRLSHGPDWTSDTTRSAGTLLVSINGLWLNSASITNGPAAQRGTYVGTTRSDASSQLNWVVPGNATAGNYAVFNAYNRVMVAGTASEGATSWTYSSTTIRPSNGGTAARISFMMGLAEDGIYSSVLQALNVPATSALLGGSGSRWTSRTTSTVLRTHRSSRPEARRLPA